MKKENEKEFRESVISLIDRVKEHNEGYKINLRDFDMFTESGLKRLSIPSNSIIEIKCFFDSNFETFRKAYLQCVRFLEKHKSNLILICNLSSEIIDAFSQKLDFDDNFRIVSFDDLNNVEFDLLANDRFKQDYKMFPNFKKSISFDGFNDFLLSLIRVDILIYAFPSGTAKMNRIIAQKDDVFPFAFYDKNNEWHIFIREKSSYSKRSILFQDGAFVHKVGIRNYDDSTEIRIDGVKQVFQKMTRKWFSHHIPFFNSYSAVDIVPKDYQYKYRKFGKTKISEFDETIVDKYVKKVIEENEIYFSAKEQLNDPFDLDADLFSTKTGYTSSNYRIFCTAGKNDNILMWSHYGDSHSGYCTSYQPREILEAIENSDKIDFCIYGYVNYKNIRKVSLKRLSYLSYFFDKATMSFILQILQLFKKYKDWSYEGEFRYIASLERPLVKKNLDTGESIDIGISINVKPKEYYFGNSFNFNHKTKAYLSKFIGSTCFSFDLSKDEYKLDIKSIELP